MTIFDPKNRPKSDKKDEGVPAGDYLLAITSITRRTGQSSGKDYFRTRVVVCHGPAAKGSFFCSLSLDTDNAGAMGRLSLLGEQLETGPFNLDDDDDCKRVLLNRPFKARVTRLVNGQYVNNDIARYLNKEVTDRDRQLMQAWVLEQSERQQYSGGGDREPIDEHGMPNDGDVPPPSDDDYGGPRRGGGGRRGGDDLPF